VAGPGSELVDLSGLEQQGGTGLDSSKAVLKDRAGRSSAAGPRQKNGI